MAMPPSSPNQLSLAIASSAGLDDAVLNAPLPDMALPAETSSAVAAASVELPSDQTQQLAEQHHQEMEVDTATVPSSHVVSEPHQLAPGNPISAAVEQQHSVQGVPDPQGSGSVLVEAIAHVGPQPSSGVIVDAAPDIDVQSSTTVLVEPTPDVVTQGNPDAQLLTVDSAVERPAKRRRGGRRATNPNMTTEERRRQRVLKNRESAMRSLAKKAAFSQQLAETQQNVIREQEEKTERLRKLIDTAIQLRGKLDATGESELAASISDCVERCNLVLGDTAVADPTDIPVAVAGQLPPLSQATVSLAPALIPPSRLHQG